MGSRTFNKKGTVRLPNGLIYWEEGLSKKKCFIREEFSMKMVSTAIGYGFNGDPFDNLIVATAAELDLPLITKDATIIDSNLIEIYW